MTSSAPSLRRFLPMFGIAAGLAIAGSLLWSGRMPWAGPREFVERVVTRPNADPTDVIAWTEQRERRAKRLEAPLDPPGDGPVVAAKYWLSLPPYEMEIRRRGARATLSVHGVDAQTDGGGWTAFAEGTVTGDADSFKGSVARLQWSCIGLRHRRSSMGVAKLTFSADARTFDAVYLQGAEALAIPTGDTYVKAYGRRADLGRPAYGELRGQIPYMRALPRHAADAKVVVTGVVRERDGGPVADAAVQVQGVHRTRVHTDERGRFSLEFRGIDAPWTQAITAGAFGWRNGQTILFTGEPTDGIVIELEPIDLEDHPSYRWIHPAPDRDVDDPQACGTCHPWQFSEWSTSRHARAADNGHVLFERTRMRRHAPDAPDDCAACHEPGYAAETGKGDYAPRGTLAANHCDFCHKIRHTADVRAPGVFGSLVLARPDPSRNDRPGDIHRVFGTSPDVTYAYMGAAYSPWLGTSSLCAGCHQGGGLPGRPKIGTYDEWRAWASTREDERFRSCQDCHMPGARTRNAEGIPIDLFAWEALHRSKESVHAHDFAGTGASFARDALDVKVTKRRSLEEGRWIVTVVVTNRGAGHAIPTGTWTKHVAIGIWARQGEVWLAAAAGAPRAVLTGDARSATGALVGGDWSNPPGTIFGVFDKSNQRLAPDFWAPPAAEDVDDRRLAAGASVTLDVPFIPVAGGETTEPIVEVRAIHRRVPLVAGPASVPYEPRRYDAPPEVEWLRIVR